MAGAHPGDVLKEQRRGDGRRGAEEHARGAEGPLVGGPGVREEHQRASPPGARTRGTAASIRAETSATAPMASTRASLPVAS